MDRSTPSHEQVRQLVSEHMDQLHGRGAPQADPLVALVQLHDQLVAAAKAYEAGPQQQREAVCEAIIAVSEFLKGQGFSGATLVPLSRVVWAIVDVCDRNHPDPLFCEKPSKTKGRRNLEDAVRKGQIAAIADAWLESSSGDEGDEDAKLNRAARYMSGAYFGALNRKALTSAKSYQRQAGHHELIYSAYAQMRDALAAEARVLGDGPANLRAAILVQIKALNTKAEMQRR
ncbi:hypothetical protein [Novosphingobium aerophilum]|uniref:Uncharacterized protein n=1 Tax=Novosphingobium aerophilum TaxID=2839843 RepID=A0A7X1F6K1_9SPHN|nr:hypothetical protein [Novosphingobium aerophilum]MBC2651357.1 hypothetical protein [Novosphingobium aerophilum]